MKRARGPLRQAAALVVLALGIASCHRSCSYSTSLSFGPDAGLVAAPFPADAAASASSSAVAADAGGVPARFAGVFHLPSPLDEANLALDPDGTFHTRFYGCDVGHESCGAWTAKGSLVVLTPRDGARTMDWINDGSSNVQVTHVDVAEHEGHLEVRAYTPDGASFAQIWLPGRVCAACGGSGPMKKAPFPCDTPFPSTCP